MYVACSTLCFSRMTLSDALRVIREMHFAKADLAIHESGDHMRPSEVDLLLGDPRRARERFGWEPKVTFKGLVEMMVDADIALAKREAAIAKLP